MLEQQHYIYIRKPTNLVCPGYVLPFDLVVSPAEYDNATAVSSQNHAVSDASSRPSTPPDLVPFTSYDAANGKD